MTPDTVHRIAQEIRHFRALLTVEETYTKRQAWSPMKEETFRRIRFWRGVLKVADERLAASDGDEAEHEPALTA